MNTKKDWIADINSGKVSEEEFIQNFSEISNLIKSKIGSINFNIYKSMVHNLKNKYNKLNVDIEDVVDMKLNPWLNPQTMGDRLRIFLKMNGSEDLFGGRL
jgi:hypothetical protein